MLIGYDYYGIALIITLVARFIPDGRELLVKEHVVDDRHEKEHLAEQTYLAELEHKKKKEKNS